jgi:hypothetical protein
VHGGLADVQLSDLQQRSGGAPGRKPRHRAGPFNPLILVKKCRCPIWIEASGSGTTPCQLNSDFNCRTCLFLSSVTPPLPFV